MERGVVVTKYGKRGAAGQRVLFLDEASMSVAWRGLDSPRSPARYRRSRSFTNFLKGQKEGLALAHLIEVQVRRLYISTVQCSAASSPLRSLP